MPFCSIRCLLHACNYYRLPRSINHKEFGSSACCRYGRFRGDSIGCMGVNLVGSTGQVAAAGVQHPFQRLSCPPLLQVSLKEDALEDGICQGREGNGTGQVDAAEGHVLIVPQTPAPHSLQVGQQAGHLFILCQHSTWKRGKGS